jgi:hypothetical protein
MNYLPYLFPLFFISMFVFVLFILSKKGWSDLANEYQFEDFFEGERVGVISAAVKRRGILFEASVHFSPFSQAPVHSLESNKRHSR